MVRNGGTPVFHYPKGNGKSLAIYFKRKEDKGMAEIIRENPIGDFIQDMLDVLEANTFDEIIWVGMHGWLSYVTRVFWLKGYKMETVITNTDSRWGQEAYENEDGHKLRFTSLDYAKEIGNRAVYIIANRHVEELKAQLMDLGISGQRIFGFKDGVTYHKEANNRLAEKVKGYRRMTHKEVQGVLLNLLKEFKRFCEEHNLTYFLDGGTLLGAVRHQGFIPWDNDADVIMPFGDYQKLIELYPSGGRYEVIDWSNSDVYYKGFAELGDNTTCTHMPYYSTIDPVHIDIFPLTGYPDSTKEKNSQVMERERLGEKWRECAFLSEFGVKDEREIIFKKLCENHIHDCEKLVHGTQTTYRLVGDKFAIFDRACYEKDEKILFEGTYFSAPIGWDKVLSEYYWDYTNLPSVEARVGYPNKFYWKNVV